MTYRSAAEWSQRFDRLPIRADLKGSVAFGSEFAVQGYLETQARKFVTAFDANCYLYLSRAMDRFDLWSYGGRVLADAGLESALVLGVTSDLLFSIDEQRALGEAFSAAGVRTRFMPLTCIEGHDSFLIDIERFGREIHTFLSGG